MAIIVDTQETWDYILESDRELPKEGQTVWHLRALTLRERNQVTDGAAMINADSRKISIAKGSTELEMVRLGLAGWDNLRDSNGKLVEPVYESNGRRSVVKLGCLDSFRPEWIEELALAVDRGARLSEDDKKKSSSSPV